MANREQSSLIEQDDNTKEVEKFIKINLIIEDNGVGISINNIKKLFTDFTKLKENADMNDKGTGLGLSICKQIISAMGGDIHVTSELG